MSSALFSGAATALVTPMKPDGSIHWKSLERLVEHQLCHHIDGLVVAGTTGEAPTLTKEEYRRLVRRVADQVQGRVPVFAGAGTNDTGHSVELARTAYDELLHSLIWEYSRTRDLLNNQAGMDYVTGLFRSVYKKGYASRRYPGETARFLGVFYRNPEWIILYWRISAKLKQMTGRNG